MSGWLGGQVSKSRLGTDCGSCWKKARVLQKLAFHFHEYGLCTVPKCPGEKGRLSRGHKGTVHTQSRSLPATDLKSIYENITDADTQTLLTYETSGNLSRMYPHKI